LLVTGCSSQSRFGQDDRICSIPLGPPPAAAKNLYEQMAVTERCIHAWSYRLARAPGGNREIAEAALGGCRDAIIREANFLLAVEKQQVTFENEQAAFERLRRPYFDMALFHVVQARAGNCDIP
jgi:hypothetical protein